MQGRKLFAFLFLSVNVIDSIHCFLSIYKLFFTFTIPYSSFLFCAFFVFFYVFFEYLFSSLHFVVNLYSFTIGLQCEILFCSFQNTCFKNIKLNCDSLYWVIFDIKVLLVIKRHIAHPKCKNHMYRAMTKLLNAVDIWAQQKKYMFKQIRLVYTTLLYFNVFLR